MFSKHRLEALSDAIFAIAMTLLVLDLKVPDSVVPGHLWEALGRDRDAWISFALTFFIAARFWVLQHKVFDVLETFADKTVAITFVFLSLVTVLPFSTSLLSHHLSERPTFCIYFLNQFAIAVALAIKLELAAYRAHLRPGVRLAGLRLDIYAMCASLGIGVISALVFSNRWVAVAPAIVAFLGRRAKRFIKPSPVPAPAHHTQ